MAIETRKKLTANYVQAVIEKFKKKLTFEEIPAKRIILFGSYAKNKPHVDSDIDVAVILESGKNIDREKIDSIMWWAKQIEVKLEPHVLSENDLANRWLSLPAEIKKYGIEV